MNREIRVILADDHPIVRQGLRQMIESDPQLSVIAEASNGLEALDLIKEHQPQIALIDVDMPEMDGFAVAREIERRRIAVEIIFLTMHSKPEIFYAAMDAGAKGFVLKDSAVSDIVASIKTVAAGQSYISPILSNLLINRSRREAELVAAEPGLETLSPTELKVLKMIAEGQSSVEIAETLFISRRTVESHRANISRKLNLQGNLSLVKFALENKNEL
ncbi:MAG: response regulator transcription factor [Acidobacteriota bacterium]